MSAHTSKDFSYAQYEELMNLTFEKCRELGKLKGSEYSGDLDRLANFRRNGLKLQLPMEVVWAVYAAKHWDAIAQYIKDIQKDKKRDRLETIEGRIDDLIVYLVLFKCMVYERTIY